MPRFTVSAAHNYDNWSQPFATFEKALDDVTTDVGGCICALKEYDDDGVFVKCHGIYRWGRKFETVIEASNSNY